jgi:hypothetical protein
MATAHQQRSSAVDNDAWWHQLDLEMQEREELERIEACNQKLDELKENDDAE